MPLVMIDTPFPVSTERAAARCPAGEPSNISLPELTSLTRPRPADSNHCHALGPPCFSGRLFHFKPLKETMNEHQLYKPRWL